MVNMTSDKVVPPSVMDVLRIFLAASIRGEEAVLVLDTRQGKLTTKYRRVETLAGTPATTSTSTTPKRKMNPARVRRSRLRLEKFNQKKEEEKEGEATKELQQTGIQKQLVIEVANGVDIGRETGAGLPSPILQLDGNCVDEVGEEEIKYTFKSEYAEEDILDSLEEIFPDNEVKLESRVAISPPSTDGWMCTVSVKQSHGLGFSWPDMAGENKEVFKEPRKRGRPPPQGRSS